MAGKKDLNANERFEEGAVFQYEYDEILLGAPSSYSLTHDAKHLAFVLSRYKFWHEHIRQERYDLRQQRCE